MCCAFALLSCGSGCGNGWESEDNGAKDASAGELMRLLRNSEKERGYEKAQCCVGSHPVRLQNSAVSLKKSENNVTIL